MKKIILILLAAALLGASIAIYQSWHSNQQNENNFTAIIKE